VFAVVFDPLLKVLLLLGLLLLLLLGPLLLGLPP